MPYKHKETGHIEVPVPGGKWEKRLEESDQYQKVSDSQVKTAEKKADEEQGS